MRLKAPGRWELRCELERDSTTGRRRQISRTFYGSEREASRALARLVVEAGAIDEGREGGTVADVFREWVEFLDARGRERATLIGYQSKWKHVEPHLGHLPIRALTTSRVDRLYSTLRSSGVNAPTVVAIHRMLRAMCNQARRWKIIEADPVVDATPPAHRPRPPAAPEAKAVRALLLAAEEDDPALAAFLRVSASLGTRRGETVALRWCDLGEGVIQVERAVVHHYADGQGLTVKATKTHAAGPIPADDTTLAVLARLRDRAERRAKRVGVPFDPQGYIFTDDPTGATPWMPNNVTHRVKRLRAHVPGAESVTVKSLRVFVATTLVDLNVDVRSAQSRLRHSQPSTTLGFYSARRNAPEVAAARAIGSVLDAG